MICLSFALTSSAGADGFKTHQYVSNPTRICFDRFVWVIVPVNCKGCDSAKKWLQENMVESEWVSAVGNKEAESFLKSEKIEAGSLPVFRMFRNNGKRDERIIGFDAEKLSNFMCLN